MLEIWDQDESILGSNFGDVFPEFREQGFDAILKNVWHTGETYLAENTAADVKINGVLTRFYFDFEYRALKRDGQIYAILHTAKEVSERMAAWEALAEKERQQKALNQELAASNEEIQAYSEEYQTLNEKLNNALEDLSGSYQELKELHLELASTEDRAAHLLEHAPVAIGVYDVYSKTIKSGNRLFKELWKIDHLHAIGVLNPFLSEDWIAFFDQMVQKVVDSGKEETLLDKKIEQPVAEKTVSSFHNLTFQPIKDKDGRVNNVFIVASEVTEQTLEKQKVDLALEQAKLAKKAGGFGVFDFDLTSQKLTCDDQCRQIMEVAASKEISYDKDFLTRINSTDRIRVQREIKAAFDTANLDSHINTTFRLQPSQKQVLKWAKLSGQVYYDRKGIAQRFIGTITDVTPEILIREELLYREQILQENNAELAATTEELAATNEELLATNEDLQRSKEHAEEINKELRISNQKLAESEERLAVAIRSSQMGVWDVNFIEKRLTWDARAKRIFGLAEQDEVAYDTRWQRIHPEDLETLQEAVSVSKTPKSDGMFSAQFRTLPNAQGRHNWVQLQGQVYFLADGTPARFAGTVIDITERIVSQQQIDTINRSIAQKEIEQRMIVDASRIGTYSYDLGSKIVNTNKYFSEILQLPANRDLWTEKVFKIPVTKDGTLADRLLLDLITEQSKFDIELELPSSSSTQKLWLRFVGQQVSVQDKAMIYGIVLDISLQKMEEKRKMDFLGIVSHELKSPLTSLSGYIQIMENKSKKAENKLFSSLLANAARQNARMKNLIEGFLDVARIGEGKLSLKRKAFDTAVLFEHIQTTYSETVNSHKLTFKADSSQILDADQDKIEQVIINLVNNAIKYAPTGTAIHIESEVTADHFLVSVSDQGPGISEENQQKLFSRFFRVENEHTALIGGFGIGLFICREIIRLHAGEIGIQSELGKGATFWFKIPL